MEEHMKINLLVTRNRKANKFRMAGCRIEWKPYFWPLFKLGIFCSVKINLHGH